MQEKAKNQERGIGLSEKRRSAQNGPSAVMSGHNHHVQKAAHNEH
jgi:hypothetical protein